jgi:hypothetical protein
MIKANELRLNNYFLFKGEAKKVKHIWPYGVGIPTEEGEDWTQVLEIEEIEPIPLTPEIFEKAGFDDAGFNSYHLGSYVWKDNYLDFGTWGARCEYLHQLQNLYFALTGEELTLDLCTNA